MFLLEYAFLLRSNNVLRSPPESIEEGWSVIAKANKYLKIFKHCIENEIIHVIAIGKEKHPTRHLSRSEAKRNKMNLGLTLFTCKQS